MVVVSVLSAPAIELFGYRYHAEEGRVFEYVCEIDEPKQSAPKTVSEEKAAEIAADWVPLRARNLEQRHPTLAFLFFRTRLKD